MKNGKQPNPNVIHPIKGYDKEIYIKPSISTFNFPCQFQSGNFLLYYTPFDKIRDHLLKRF